MRACTGGLRSRKCFLGVLCTRAWVDTSFLLRCNRQGTSRVSLHSPSPHPPSADGAKAFGPGESLLRGNIPVSSVQCCPCGLLSWDCFSQWPVSLRFASVRLRISRFHIIASGKFLSGGWSFWCVIFESGVEEVYISFCDFSHSGSQPCLQDNSL